MENSCMCCMCSAIARSTSAPPSSSGLAGTCCWRCADPRNLVDLDMLDTCPRNKVQRRHASAASASSSCVLASNSSMRRLLDAASPRTPTRRSYRFRRSAAIRSATSTNLWLGRVPPVPVLPDKDQSNPLPPLPTLGGCKFVSMCHYPATLRTRSSSAVICRSAGGSCEWTAGRRRGGGV